MGKKLYKSRTNVKVDGVCAGFADYLRMDPTLVRILMVILSFPTGFATVIFYIICALIMPREPKLDPQDIFYSN